MHRSLTLFALAALLGCNDVTAPSPQRSDLETNRQKWRARGYTDYSFTLRVSCFCIEVEPLRVTVVGDSAVSVVRISNGQPSLRTDKLTINKLFDLIDQAIKRPNDDLRVTYDNDLGFPREIYSDGSFRIADDEVMYTVSDVVRRP